MFDRLREPTKYFTDATITEDHAMTENSSYFDIGSGFGLPSILLRYILDCETYGVEANEYRFKSS